MANEELRRLAHLFVQAAESKRVSVEELFRDALLIFEILTVALERAPLERKQELLSEMREMHGLLSQEIARLCEALGVTEEELLSFSQNPEHFSPEQWQLIETTRKNLDTYAQRISKILTPSILGKDPTKVPPSIVKKALPKTKKTGWMKS